MHFWVILLHQAIIHLSYEKCVMRSGTLENETVHYNKSAIPLPPDGIKIFEKLCSSSLPPKYKSGDSIDTCCSLDQLKVFSKQISMLENLIPQCGICRENIKRLTCVTICNANQSQFSRTYLKNNSYIVAELELAVGYEYAEGLFNSCKDVKFPNSIQPVISFICRNSVGKCDPEKLVISLMSFSTELKITPIIFKVNQTLPAHFSSTVNPITAKCNETYNGYNLVLKSCSCQDCEDTCSPIPTIIIPKKSLIFKVFTVYQFVVLVVYTIFVIASIGIYTTLYKGFILLEKEDKTTFETITCEETMPLNEEQFLSNPARENQMETKLMNFISNFLKLWGTFVASHKITVILFSVSIITILGCGVLFNLKMTSDPIEIWSPKNSEFRKNKEYFDKYFGPFYRTEQILIKAPKLHTTNHSYPGLNVTFGRVLNKQIIKELFRIEKDILNLTAKYQVSGSKDEKNVTFRDICYMATEPLNHHCTMFSVTQYFQNDESIFERNGDDVDWGYHLYFCVENPASMNDLLFDGVSCFSDFNTPVNPKLVLGGYSTQPMDANVLVITYVVKNNIDKDLNIPAVAWERSLIQYLRNYSHQDIEISFSVESSIQDEIDRQTHSETLTVFLSYFAMFCYVSLALGGISYGSFKQYLVNQKIIVGFIGVVLVYLSVLGSIGFFCYLKFKVNMIVLEVLPFLALAVGVDNLFLMVGEYRRIKSASHQIISSVPEMIGLIMSKVGHGMVVSAFAQVTTFSIGAISNIPAVKTFSLFAAVALGINFFMQITLLLVVFTYDIIRERSKRPPIFCCIKLSDYDVDFTKSDSFTERVFEKLSRIILNRYAKPLIVFFFISSWVFGIYLIPSISVGLDQTVALPMNSYLHNYFGDVFNYLKTGPPTYFMVHPDYRYEQTKYQNLICSGVDCDPHSLTSTIFYYSRISQISKIATAADSWVDTYLAWLKSSGENTCCKNRVNTVTKKKEFCPSYLEYDDCEPCFNSKFVINITEEEFGRYLPWFLEDIPVASCPLGGKPAFGKSVKLNPDYYNETIKKSTTNPVITSSFMTYHTSLGSSDDLIAALSHAIMISKNISKTLNHTVVPYSVFYIFYESYFTIRKEASISFVLSFVAVSLVNLFLYGFEFRMTSIITVLIFAMNAVNGGMMYILSISLNPVSLVNLIMFIGINVEFLSHIGRGYLSSDSKSRTERARSSLITTGSCVFSGIAMTKILGILVLAFSNSLLFRVYYFYMYACAIVVGSLHGLILLPVLLSYFGPITTSRTQQNEEALISLIDND